MGEPRQLKRRHHTVPQFHLERFSNDRGQVARAALPGDKRDLVAIRDASVKKDFYLIESEDGTRSDELENRLGEMEGAAAGAVREHWGERRPSCRGFGLVWPAPAWPLSQRMWPAGAATGDL